MAQQEPDDKSDNKSSANKKSAAVIKQLLQTV